MAPLLLFQLSVVAWPAIAALDHTVVVDDLDKGVFVKIPLLDHRGDTIYTLMCRGGTVEYLERVSPKIIWVEPFACRLFEGTTEYEGSLLGHDESPPWHTRGQVKSIDELLDPEAQIRIFQLRGIELRLEFQKVASNGFVFNVKVKPDPSITSERVEVDEPRYCRSDSPHNFGSWELCK